MDSLKGAVHKVQVAFADKERVYTQEDFKGMEILHFDKKQSIYHIIIKGTEEEINNALAPYHPVLADLIPLTLEEIFIYELEGLGYDSNIFD